MADPGVSAPRPQHQLENQDLRASSTKEEISHGGSLSAGSKGIETLDSEQRSIHPLRTQEASDRERAMRATDKRRTHILDLPNEILLDISERVKDHQRQGSVHGSQDGYDPNISSLRQTCRRFYEVSSHLLLDYVRVEVTSSSLARLDYLSRHPLLSGGIKGIEVWLTYYAAEPAESKEKFIGKLWWFIEKRMGRVRRCFYQPWSNDGERKIAVLTEMIEPLRIGNTFIKACKTFSATTTGLGVLLLIEGIASQKKSTSTSP